MAPDASAGGYAGPRSRPRWLLPALVLILVLGLGLRLAAARGGLWLDEAWSAFFAREARGPAAVIFAINHDNNHIANTLWLQLVGWDSSPIVARGLSILTGTAAIPVAALIGLRRNPIAALVAALLFAVSPMLVAYGSEARGYAPMVLAFLVAIWLVDRWLAGQPARSTPQWLAMAAGLGMLAHVTLMFGLAALALWTMLALARRETPVAAFRMTAGLFWRAACAVSFTLLLVAIGALASARGYTVGNLAPFGFTGLLDGFGMMMSIALGAPLEWARGLLPLLLILVPLGWLGPIRDRFAFHALAILALPLAVAVFQVGNSGFARYYLTCGIALLLLLADLAAMLVVAGGWRRITGLAMLAVPLAASLSADLVLIRDQRGDPMAAVRAMRLHAPAGATVLIDNERSLAVIEVAAATQAYPLTIVTEACSGALFLFTDENGHSPPPDTHVLRCGNRFVSIESRGYLGLSGQSWRLYRRVGPSMPAAEGK